MKPAELAQEISIEFDSIRRSLEELTAIQYDVEGREPTIRELAAAGLFLANKWMDMLPGVEGAVDVFAAFQSAVDRHLAALAAEED